MTTPVPPLELDLDPSNYLQGLGQADKATEQFGGTIRATTVALTPMQRALDAVTPSRALLGGLGLLAGRAAATQAQLATMSASAKTTGASMDKLTGSMRSLAREYPVGNAGARQLMQQMTQLGISARGSEVTVGKLAKTFTQLSGATGERPGGLAQGFVQLNRVMGTGFNPQRMSKLADSLTEVSAKSGASATSVLQFAKAIAPMSQIAGIGETKVLGISAAFSRLGEDGFGAANAFNKMLGDISTSVRDGSPMLNTYASIVGKTAAQFEALFKANPTEALAQVFESVGSGPKGARQLEALGLDSARHQRIITEVGGTGGIREAAATATDAYGGGATKRAADEAFKGLADSTQRAAANAQQLGEAFGAPLLGPLTTFTDALGATISPLRALAESTPGRKTLSTLAEVAIGGVLLSKLIKPLASGAMIAQALSSAPVRAAIGSFALSRSGADVTRMGTTRLGRALGTRTAAEMVTAPGPMSGNRVVNWMATQTGRAGALAGGMIPGAPGLMPGLGGQLRGFGMAAPAAYMRMIGESARQARIPANERTTSRMSPVGRVWSENRQAAEATQRLLQQRLITQAEADAARQTRRMLLRTTMAEQGVRGGVWQGARTAAWSGMQLGALAGTGLARGGGALMGAMGGPVGLALTGAMVGGTMIHGMRQRSAARDQAERERAQSGSTSFLDEYRVAMGKAISATDTFAGRLNAAAETMTKGITSMADATRVDAHAERIARDTKTQTKKYTGSTEGIAGQINQAIAMGAEPDEVARMRTDLIKQYGAPRAKEIMGGVRQGQSLSSDLTGDIRAQVAGVADYRQKRGWGGWMGSDDRDVNDTGPGMRYTTGGQRQTAEDVAAGIQERYTSRAETGGQEYAGAQARKEMDAAVGEALEQGSTDFAQQIMMSIQKQNGLKNARISKEDIDKAGGFGQYMAQTRPEFAARYGTDTSEQVAQKQRSYVEKQLSGSGNILGDLFGEGGGSAGDLVRQLVAKPGDVSLQSKAPQAVLASVGGNSAQDLAALADAAGQAANKLGNIDDAATQFLNALHDMAQRMATIRSAGGSTSSGVMLRAQMAAADASIDPTNDVQAAQKAKGVSTLQDTYVQAMEMAQQRLTQQREFQVQMGRMDEDYASQRQRSEFDYNRSIARMREDYNTGHARQQQDFNKGQYRAQRDFNISMKQATEDFNKSRYRTIRDFNKAIGREIADSARTIMDPYKRIATQPIWDTQTLMMNMQQQTKAIADQLANLNTLRESGVSNAVIEMLGLNDPANAQQLGSMVNDLISDPALVAQLNETASGRNTVAAALVGDPSNIGLARQKEDLKTGLSDMLTDFTTSTERAREAFRRTRDDASKDFATAMEREFKDYRKALKRSAEDRTAVMERMGKDYSKAVRRMSGDLARADQEIVGNLSQLTSALNKAVSGQFVNYQKLTTNGMKGWVSILQQFAGQWEQHVNGMSATAKLTVTTSTMPGLDGPHTNARSREGYADGALFTYGGAPRQFADGATWGEQSPEVILPLDQRGTRFLAGVMERLSSTEIKTMSTAQSSSTVHYHSDTYTYDQRNDYSGAEIVVQAQDPDELARKLEARSARANMTSMRPAGSRS